jgi:hypothetical protein
MIQLDSSQGITLDESQYTPATFLPKKIQPKRPQIEIHEIELMNQIERGKGGKGGEDSNPILAATKVDQKQHGNKLKIFQKHKEPSIQTCKDSRVHPTQKLQEREGERKRKGGQQPLPLIWLS